MIDYAFPTLHVNGRTVAIEAIINQDVPPGSDFETDTFAFIRRWYSPTTSFTLHTSGSTGTPKEITFTREQFEQSALATGQALGLIAGTTALVCLPTRYVAGQMMLVRAFVLGMRILAVDPTSTPLEDHVMALHPDFAAFVPLQTETMLAQGWADRLNTLSHIIIGGATIHPSLRKNIQQHLTNQVYSTYGMTETISHIALSRLHDDTDTYQPLPGITLTTDARGCLSIHCPYLRNPVVTNDLVTLNPDKSFHWRGRADYVINSGGIKVVPEEMEKQIGPILTAMGIQCSFFIAGLPDERLGQRVVLCLESAPLPSSQYEKIVQNIEKSIPSHVRPRGIVSINEFIYTKTGKISRIETLKIHQKK